MERTTEKRINLSEHDSKLFLKKFDVPVTDEILAITIEEAVDAAQRIGFPVVLKGHGEKITHKTERNLVRLDLQDENALRKAAGEIVESTGPDISGFLVQQKIPGRREFVVGMFRDEQFGPVIMFGTGGIFTEALSDTVFRIPPITETDAVEMLEEIRAKKLLGPFRGEKAADRYQLVQTIMGVARVAMECPDVSEIDINPLIVAPDGRVTAVDALVVKGEGTVEKEYPPRNDPVAVGKFFHPRSIAFVGATSTMGKWGHTLLTGTISRGFDGDIYLVNPRGGSIANRSVYRTVLDIPGKVDLAVVTIPADKVQDLIPQFREKKIQHVILITSGFGETGEEGRKLEKKLVRQCREAGILFIGPNTMGIINPHIKLYCTGAHVWPLAGSTTVVAQSGNMGAQLLGFAEKQGIGIRGFSGSGNEAMITIEDYLEALEDDKLTKNIILYVESVKNAPRFFESAHRIGKKKPIMLLKGGQTEAGTKAAASHTGAMVTNSRVFDAACRQSGIIKVDHPMDLLDLAAAFSALPLPKGNRVAIMTLGGGWGVVSADMCNEFGLNVPELTPDIVEKFDKILPAYWSRSNPVDIVGENDNTIPVTVIEELLKWDGCDGVLNLGILGKRHLLERLSDSIMKSDPTYSPEFLLSVGKELREFEEEYIEFIIKMMEKYQKPVFGVSIFSETEKTLQWVEGREMKGLFFPTPERAVKAFAGMYQYWKFLNL